MNAHERYSLIDDGRLGDEFVDVAESAAELILRWPDGPPPYRGRLGDPMIHAWHLGKFPYRLVYTVREEDVYVLAYAHEARRPDYWSHRLDD